ncbi:MAG: hypothetical protein HYT71_01925 [Candidatus Aenigmarchaeota archaeon]|nr:hypothetical protein [Candidatus Aenigmarchaeota archaeon]
MREQDEAMRQGIESARSSASMPDTNPMRAIMARVYERQEVARKLQVQQKMTRQYLESGEDIGVAQIQHQRGSLTVYEQTGYSHISHVAGEGYHLTTQVPGIGRDEGLDEGLSFHTYVKPNRSGRLKFDSE